MDFLKSKFVLVPNGSSFAGKGAKIVKSLATSANFFFQDATGVFLTNQIEFPSQSFISFSDHDEMCRSHDRVGTNSSYAHARCIVILETEIRYLLKYVVRTHVSFISSILP